MNKKDEFIKALKQKSKIKLDIIYSLNGQYGIYFFLMDNMVFYIKQIQI